MAFLHASFACNISWYLLERYRQEPATLLPSRKAISITLELVRYVTRRMNPTRSFYHNSRTLPFLAKITVTKPSGSLPVDLNQDPEQRTWRTPETITNSAPDPPTANGGIYCLVGPLVRRRLLFFHQAESERIQDPSSLRRSPSFLFHPSSPLFPSLCSRGRLAFSFFTMLAILLPFLCSFAWALDFVLPKV